MNNRLKGSKVLIELQAETLQRLEDLGTFIQISPNHQLFGQDDPADALYVVEDGVIEISVFGPNGRKLILNYMKSGDVFGEIAALDGGARTAAATAIEATRLLKIARSDVVALMTSEPAIAIELIGVLCRRIRWISSQLEERSSLPVSARLAGRLLLLNEKLSKDDDRIHISQNELAHFVSATRESVNKLLVQWQNAGWITLTRGTVSINDQKALSDLIERAEDGPRN